MSLGETFAIVAGSKFSARVKLIDSGQARIRLISRRAAAPRKVYLTPTAAAAPPQITPPKGHSPLGNRDHRCIHSPPRPTWHCALGCYPEFASRHCPPRTGKSRHKKEKCCLLDCRHQHVNEHNQ